MELKVVQFIKENKDWEKLLSEKPYAISVSRKEKFGRRMILLKYSQIDSDFSIDLVRECRGLILDEDTLEIISFPFKKFCNFGEPYADKIDWNSACVLEKVDGSLIKIARLGNDYLVSTNGTIDADDAPIPEQVGCQFKSFGELVQHVLWKYDLTLDFMFLDENVTYMFELVSPFTRVVIPYQEADLYFLGARDNITHKEILPQDHRLVGFFKTPKVYSFKSFEDCMESAKELPWDSEGYVVVDKDFHRVKVKSPAWIAVHHLHDNGVFSKARALEIVRANELDEVFGYFPELSASMYEIKDRYDGFVAHEQSAWEYLIYEFDIENATRKELAIWITKNFDCPGIGFAMLDHKVDSVEQWIRNCPADHLLKNLGFK